MRNESLPLFRNSHMEPGEIYFWTATITKWRKLMIEDKFKSVVIESLDHLSRRNMLDIFGFVVMPNHLHFIWRENQLNGKESPHKSFLKFTAHQFRKMLLAEGADKLLPYAVDAHNKCHEFWQRDSLAVHLYTRNVAFQKLDYIHNNPMVGHWDIVKDPCDYKFSSAKFYEMGVKEFGFLKDLRYEF